VTGEPVAQAAAPLDGGRLLHAGHDVVVGLVHHRARGGVGRRLAAGLDVAEVDGLLVPVVGALLRGLLVGDGLVELTLKTGVLGLSRLLVGGRGAELSLELVHPRLEGVGLVGVPVGLVELPLKAGVLGLGLVQACLQVGRVARLVPQTVLAGRQCLHLSLELLDLRLVGAVRLLLHLTDAVDDAVAVDGDALSEVLEECRRGVAGVDGLAVPAGSRLGDADEGAVGVRDGVGVAGGGLVEAGRCPRLDQLPDVDLGEQGVVVRHGDSSFVRWTWKCEVTAFLEGETADPTLLQLMSDREGRPSYGRPSLPNIYAVMVRGLMRCQCTSVSSQKTSNLIR